MSNFATLFGVAEEEALREAASRNGRSDIMACFAKAFAGGIDVEALLRAEDPALEGSIKAPAFKQLLRALPLGLTETDVENIMTGQLAYTDVGDVDYVRIVSSLQFKEMRFSFKLKRSLVQESEFDEFQRSIDKDKRAAVMQQQRVIVESLIYIEDFELIVYTTICPCTSLIFVSKTNRSR
jgi:hypothetical protein